jgi:hypothetical protein
VHSAFIALFLSGRHESLVACSNVMVPMAALLSIVSPGSKGGSKKAVKILYNKKHLLSILHRFVGYLTFIC